LVEADDLEAVRDVLAGRTERFSYLVRRYQRLVGSLVYRMGVPAEDSEDLVSEIFIKVYENLGRYRPDHAFSTWLYRIGANHVLDYQRRHRREKPRVELPETLPDPGPLPSASAERTEVSERVRRLLPLLDEKYRAVLILMHVEEKKVEEIAAILDLPSGTVKTRLARGRDRLAELIRLHDPGLLDEGVTP
jgi:RNA polymerase sigma-70 factor (ECF subfamily)